MVTKEYADFYNWEADWVINQSGKKRKQKRLGVG